MRTLHDGSFSWVSSTMTQKKPKPGDKAAWQSHGSTAHGEVEKKITSDTKAAGRQVRASEDDPQYLVRSDKSGGEAVHKPGALTKNGGSKT